MRCGSAYSLCPVPSPRAAQQGPCALPQQGWNVDGNTCSSFGHCHPHPCRPKGGEWAQILSISQVLSFLAFASIWGQSPTPTWEAHPDLRIQVSQAPPGPREHAGSASRSGPGPR